MLGILGQSEYGLIGTANSITSYLSLLSMGIGASYVRFNAQARATGDKEKEYRTNGMFQTIYIVISIITLIVVWLLFFYRHIFFRRIILILN
jgi:O-antigen/teichoic acid export membrane protein